MLRRILQSLLVVAVLVACSDSTGPVRGVEGTWRLHTVDGQALPFILPEEAVDKVELMGEVITMVAPGSLTIITTFRITDGSDVFLDSDPDGGTYVVNGSAVTITWASDGSTTAATVSGDTMIMEDIGHTFLYRRDPPD
jgi:hypothetical protein